MKTFPRLQTMFALALVALVATSPPGLANTRKNPTSKMFVADLRGDAEIDTGERVESLSEKSVHQAEGTVIQTKQDSTNAMVFSNGTGVAFAPETRLEVRRFVQEPFTPNRNDLETEPSISQTQNHLSFGSVGLCNARLVAGSTMVYTTPHASVNIRAQKVVIAADDNETVISVVEGDVTVRAGDQDAGGHTLEAGQQAVIRRAPGQPPVLSIRPIPEPQRPQIEDKVSMACMARRTVYFDVAERGENSEEQLGPDVFTGEEGDGDSPPPELVPVPVIPVDLPVEYTESNAILRS